MSNVYPNSVACCHNEHVLWFYGPLTNLSPSLLTQPFSTASSLSVIHYFYILLAYKPSRYGIYSNLIDLCQSTTKTNHIYTYFNRSIPSSSHSKGLGLLIEEFLQYIKYSVEWVFFLSIYCHSTKCGNNKLHVACWSVISYFSIKIGQGILSFLISLSLKKKATVFKCNVFSLTHFISA